METDRCQVLCLALTPAVQRTQLMTGYRHGQVNRVGKTIVTASGKGVNVAMVLARLGTPVRLIGLVGGDTGRYVKEAVAEAGVIADWIESAVPTRHCHTLVETDTGQVTEIVEEAVAPGTGEWSAIEEKVRDAARTCGWFIWSGAMPPGTPYDRLGKMLTLAESLGLRVLVDSQGPALRNALHACPYLVKLNREELLRTCGHDAHSAADITAAARNLIECGAQQVLVTNGAQPAILVTNKQITSFMVPKVRVINPIGSGDCVTAGIIHALGKGLPLLDAIRYGLACGSANAETETPASFIPPPPSGT